MSSIRSKSESRLEEDSIQGRLRWISPLCRVTCQVPVLQLKRCEARYVVAQASDRFHPRLIRKDLFTQRHMSIFETVVRFYRPFKPRQPVAELCVECVAVGYGIRRDVAMIDVFELAQEFRSALGPGQIRRVYPFAVFRTGGQSDLVTVDRASQLQPISFRRSGKQLGDPRSIVIDVSRITGAFDKRPTAIAHTEVVAEPKSSRRNVTLRQETHSMDRGERAAIHHQVGPIDRRLQPRAVMEGRIPIAYGCVIAAERKFKIVVIVVAD